MATTPHKPETPKHDDRDKPGPDHDRGRDKTGNIPGTPYAPAEGHKERNPGPGEPGGPAGPHPDDDDEDKPRRDEPRRPA